MKQNIKKENKRKRTDEEIMIEIQKNEKEEVLINNELIEKPLKEEAGDKSNENSNEDDEKKEEDIEKEIDQIDPEEIEWHHNDDDSLGEEEGGGSEEETVF